MANMHTDFSDCAASMPYGWIGQTVEIAIESGIDVRPALVELGVGDPVSGISRNSVITPAVFILMCAMIINAVDDEMHGTAKSRMARGTANLVVKSTVGANCLQSAIETIIRFFSIVGNTYCQLRLDTQGDAAVLRIGSETSDPEVSAVVEEMFLSFIHMQLSHFLGFLLPATQFVTTSPDHPHLGSNHPYLVGKVKLGEITALQFPKAYLGFSKRIKVGDFPLVDCQLGWIERHAEMAAGDFSGALEDSLSGEIFRLLLSHDGTFEACCRQLRLDPADVRAGLWQEGQNFRSLRRAALIRRARPLLDDGISAEELAMELGYSDGRSVRRALKSATGISLRELRSLNVPAHHQTNHRVISRLIEEVQQQV
ncbi:AraC family transcriptional regulator ligand-binding domain-containing protein [Henriciella pelagia]|jgi:AraC-like DNA-binding protein|uniref:HTH araC/xylS-type domain-containing protein n=2 Tax=Henriciella pelagia TaxID=1977912 RepID=A0ABQ1JF77_9PROT|nr:AraC family transcriptional regulator ligand-binding domain-containing protein [Henriciella pelagia]GGB67406.1 hypothetical protein GCM10011503_15250 [Henriciella pelagia]